jgi:ABC-type transport system involved in multi-copper enzyme maturation permease subunit
MNLGTDSFILLGASEWTLVRWATPLWILSMGVLVGLALLLAAYGVVWVGSKVTIFQKWQRNGLSFWIGTALSVVATALFGFYLYRLAAQVPNDGGVDSDLWLYLPSILVCFAIFFWALLYCSNRRFIAELPQTLSSGVGAAILATLVTIVCVGLLATFVVEEPRQMITGLPRLFSPPELSQEVQLAGVPADKDIGVIVPIELDYNPVALRRVKVESDRNIILSIKNSGSESLISPTRVTARNPLEWDIATNRLNAPPIPNMVGFELYGQNLELDPATVKFTIETVAEQPEMGAIVPMAAMTFFVGLAWFLQLGAAPRLSAIVLATSKSELAQPLPKILMLFAALCILLFVYLPFHTLGEDIKLLKDCGISLIMVVCLFQGVWSASSSVSDEIEGRTALTLLSKPIHRRSFILGKLLGIIWLLLLMILVLGTLELLAVAYKPLYDSQENSQERPLWQMCFLEAYRTIPGLVMVFFQVATLTTLSVGIATRLSQLANFAICFSIYLVGHLTPAIVDSSENAFPIVRFIAQLIAVITPNLDLFSMNGAIDANTPIPPVYLSGLMIYSLVFCGLSVLLGLLLFEDRDLA